MCVVLVRWVSSEEPWDRRPPDTPNLSLRSARRRQDLTVGIVGLALFNDVLLLLMLVVFVVV